MRNGRPGRNAGNLLKAARSVERADHTEPGAVVHASDHLRLGALGQHDIADNVQLRQLPRHRTVPPLVILAMAPAGTASTRPWRTRMPCSVIRDWTRLVQRYAQPTLQSINTSGQTIEFHPRIVALTSSETAR